MKKLKLVINGFFGAVIILSFLGGPALEAGSAPGPSKSKLNPIYPMAKGAGLSSTVTGPPSGFQVNLGQFDKSAKFAAQGNGYILVLTRSEAILAVSTKPAGKSIPPGRATKGDIKQGPPAQAPRPAGLLRMIHEGANRNPQLTAGERLPGNFGHYRGGDAKGWKVGIAAYAEVQCRDIYPGIDVVYAFRNGRLCYDYRIAPGADPAAISLRLEGSHGVSLAESGGLIVEVTGGRIVHNVPRIFQVIDGTERKVEGGFVVDGDTIGFFVKGYDRSQRLIIDPALDFSHLFGGSQVERSELGMATRQTPLGTEVYIAGTTLSADFPLADPLTFKGDWDGFLSKFRVASGSSQPIHIWTRFMGGGARDQAYDVALGTDGTAYVTGETASPISAETPVPFPTLNALQAAFGGGTHDAFLARFDPNGTLLSSTFLGGSEEDKGYGIAVDFGTGAGVYLAGITRSDDFQTQVTPILPKAGHYDAFLLKLDLSASAYQYFSYLGGDNTDAATDVAVRAGEAYLVGSTCSPDLPTQNPLQPCINYTPTVPSPLNCLQLIIPENDVLLAKFSADNQLVFSTYLGGNSADFGEAIALDNAGNAYITGRTWYNQALANPAPFPTTQGAYRTTPAGKWEAFAARIDFPSTGLPNLGYGTYVAGPEDDSAYGIAVDASGRALLTGYTKSGTSFAESDTQVALPYAAAEEDAFIALLNAQGSSLVFWGLIGGSGNDIGADIALADAGAVYLAGWTRSEDFYATSVSESASDTVNLFLVRFGDILPPEEGPVQPPETTPALAYLTKNQDQQEVLQVYRLTDYALHYEQAFTEPRQVVFDKTGMRLAVLDGTGVSVLSADNGSVIEFVAGDFVDADFRLTDNRDLALIKHDPSSGGFSLTIQADVGFSAEVDLPTGFMPQDVDEPRVAWSPDGSKLMAAYVVTNAFGVKQLFLIEIPVQNEELQSPGGPQVPMPDQDMHVFDVGYFSQDNRVIAMPNGFWRWGPDPSQLTPLNTVHVNDADLSYAHRLFAGALWGTSSLPTLVTEAGWTQTAIPGAREVAVSPTAHRLAIMLPGIQLAQYGNLRYLYLLAVDHIRAAELLAEGGQLSSEDLMSLEYVFPAWEGHAPALGVIPQQ